MVDNQNNTGFTFTENMTCFMSWVFDYIAKNPGLEVNYKELQDGIRKSIIDNPELSVQEKVAKDEYKAKETKWQSKIRMLFPPLYYMGVIDLPEKREERFILGKIFTDNSEPLISAVHLFKEAIKTENMDIIEHSKQVYWSILAFYRESLIRNYYLAGKEQYYLVTRYLIEFDYLDRYEFFALFSFEGSSIDGCNSPSEWIQKKRAGGQVTLEIPEVANSWGYIMRLLEELGVCYYDNGIYRVKNKNQLKLMVERIANV